MIFTFYQKFYKIPENQFDEKFSENNFENPISIEKSNNFFNPIRNNLTNYTIKTDDYWNIFYIQNSIIPYNLTENIIVLNEIYDENNSIIKQFLYNSQDWIYTFVDNSVIPDFSY